MVHDLNGVNSVSLPGYPRATDERVIQATMDLAVEFPFNLDYNSGHQLGIGSRLWLIDRKVLLKCDTGWTPLTVGNGTRSSSQTSYLGPKYIRRPNLHVLTDARVTRILDTKRISQSPSFDAVEFTQDAGST